MADTISDPRALGIRRRAHAQGERRRLERCSHPLAVGTRPKRALKNHVAAFPQGVRTYTGGGVTVFGHGFLTPQDVPAKESSFRTKIVALEGK